MALFLQKGKYMACEVTNMKSTVSFGKHPLRGQEELYITALPLPPICFHLLRNLFQVAPPVPVLPVVHCCT